MALDLAGVKGLLSDSKVTALFCDDQKVKTEFISEILSWRHGGEGGAGEEGAAGVIIYLDIDTAFTVFVESHAELPYAESLRVFRPRDNDIDDVVAGVNSLSGVQIDTVVFDSVTSLYNLRRDGMDSSKVNQSLGLYLALLTMAASRSGGRLLLTSMMRAGKRGEDKDAWFKTYAGGRLLRKRSDLILRLSRDASGLLEVSVLKSRDPLLEGATLHFKLEDE
ncbi:MAG: hypothetical protein M1503_04900 [Thaumarchaeota archaeon]|nr:hypothetical protein [Nitrososphaerota archaeon]MCL5317590.1 hypothetical protein [Nitrososphaerota archaeon]